MIYPLSMMLLLVMLLFVGLFVARVSALYTKKVDFKYYEVFKGAQAPEYLTKVTNNLNNLFEVPPIFYMAAILVIVLNIENESILFNAWGFVVARYMHSLVHITINNYLIRGSVFTVSIYFLTMLWLGILERLI
jgi:hypothetical protein